MVSLNSKIGQICSANVHILFHRPSHTYKIIYFGRYVRLIANIQLIMTRGVATIEATEAAASPKKYY